MTKLDILNQTTEQSIYFHYLNINTMPKGNISSPFTADKNPSFKLYANGTFKCHSSGNQGDVWQFVADLKNLNVKSDFNRVLTAIAEDLRLLVPAFSKTFPNKKNTTKPAQPKPDETTNENHFKVDATDLTPAHFNYYQQFKVSAETLQRYNVKGVTKFQYWNEKKNAIQKFPIYKGVIAFAYNVNDRIEIYIPKQGAKVSKFFYNGMTSEDIFGLEQIPPDTDNIIISAGKKDCLVLNSNGYNSVTFRSENHYPTTEQINLLKSKCKNLFICYDNDFTKPNNPGQSAQAKIVKQYGITPIYLPDGINDIAQLYFHNQTIEEQFKKALESISAKAEQEAVYDEANTTIFHITERYLSAHYNFRYNEIKLDIEYCKKGDAIWKSVNENSLYIEMQKKGINVSIDKLLAILKSDFVPRFNPIIKYFDELPKWKKSDPDYIDQLANKINAIDQPQFNYHFKKWLTRSVKCATIPDYFNKQAFILVHKAQNSGKTSFCRFLCPPKLKDYLAEDISNDKDARILLCKNFLINLDELAVLSRHEINSLKAYFTKSQINERLPYDRKNSIIPRVCSFIGSTNQGEFLGDETGSVRWLCFTIKSIDWSYRQQININNVWAQAFTLANDLTFDCELTVQDIEENENRNRVFEIVSVERELINKAFSKDGTTFMTSTEILQHIMATNPYLPKQLNAIAIGKAMIKEGHDKVKSTTGVYGYYVNVLQTSYAPATREMQPLPQTAYWDTTNLPIKSMNQ